MPASDLPSHCENPAPRWCQIIADALGPSARPDRGTDASALGAAIIGRAGTTEEPLHAVALKEVRRGRPFPAGSRHRRYEEVAARHVRIAQ
jgi:sugar (pentulose or hexulose) kinase